VTNLLCSLVLEVLVIVALTAGGALIAVGHLDKPGLESAGWLLFSSGCFALVALVNRAYLMGEQLGRRR
jgi:hypothetical protein